MVSYDLSEEPDKDNFSTRQNCTATLLMGRRTKGKEVKLPVAHYLASQPDPRVRWYEVVAVNGWSRPSSKRLL